jgi:hypothetical protein
MMERRLLGLLGVILGLAFGMVVSRAYTQDRWTLKTALGALVLGWAGCTVVILLYPEGF